MKPLFVLLISFVLSLLTIYIIRHELDAPLAGRIAMSLMLLFTALGHFIYTRGMMMMVPAKIPFKKSMVYLTGFFEITAAISLQIDITRLWTGWALILFFGIMLPANINAATKHIDYQKGTQDGPGLNYLWFRVPLQVFFILWVYYWVVAATHSIDYL